MKRQAGQHSANWRQGTGRRPLPHDVETPSSDNVGPPRPEVDFSSNPMDPDMNATPRATDTPEQEPWGKLERIDVKRVAADQPFWEGRSPLAQFPRLNEAHAGDAQGREVVWSARLVQQEVLGGKPMVQLVLQAATSVEMTCQRCLELSVHELAVDTQIRFVATEAEAEALDPDSDEDLLSMEHPLNLRELIEDELLLELPLVPMHDECPLHLPSSVGEEEIVGEVEKANPFAMLAQLKKG